MRPSVRAEVEALVRRAARAVPWVTEDEIQAAIARRLGRRPTVAEVISGIPPSYAEPLPVARVVSTPFWRRWLAWWMGDFVVRGRYMSPERQLPPGPPP